MYTRLAEQLVAVLADAVQSEEHGLVEDALALQVEEVAALRQIVVVWQGGEDWYQDEKQHHRDLYVAGTHLQKCGKPETRLRIDAYL